MPVKKFFLTKEGLAELKNEYQELTKHKRPLIVERVSAARDMGDLSENAEYHAAREELSLVDGRIDELEEILKQAVVIDDRAQGSGNVGLGSTVTVKVEGKQEVYTVVGEWEADPGEKKISHESPLGKALIGKSVGDLVEVAAPVGKIAYKIVKIA